jgi:hypothetical protein
MGLQGKLRGEMWSWVLSYGGTLFGPLEAPLELIQLRAGVIRHFR